jgi:hypothetical protein
MAQINCQQATLNMFVKLPHSKASPRRGQIHLCGPYPPQKLTKLFHIFELTLFVGNFSNQGFAMHFSYGMWPSNQFEFENPIINYLLNQIC